MTKYARKVVLIGKRQVGAVLEVGIWKPRVDLKLHADRIRGYVSDMQYFENELGKVAAVSADGTAAAVYDSEDEYRKQLALMEMNRGKNED